MIYKMYAFYFIKIQFRPSAAAKMSFFFTFFVFFDKALSKVRRIIVFGQIFFCAYRQFDLKCYLIKKSDQSDL
jgi:hypothetical protein